MAAPAQKQAPQLGSVVSTTDVAAKGLVAYGKGLEAPPVKVPSPLPMEKGPMPAKSADIILQKQAFQADQAVAKVRMHSETMTAAMTGPQAIDRTIARRLAEDALGEEERRDYEDEIREIEGHAERAEEARSRGEDPTAPAELATSGIEALGEVAGVVSALRRAGVSQEVIQAVRSVLRDYREGANEAERTTFRERADLVLRMARFLTENRAALEGPQMAEARGALEQMITVLGRHAREGTGAEQARELTGRAEGIFRQIEGFLRERQGAERAAMETTIQSFSDQLGRLRESVRDEGLREGLERLARQAEELRRRIAGGERPSEEDLRRMESLMSYVQNMRDNILRGREGASVAPLERILGRGLSALLGGNTEQSQAHLFMASQADRATGAARASLERTSGDLAEGRIQLPQAIRSIADHLRTRLAGLGDREGVRDEQTRSALERMSQRLAEGEPTMETLTRGAAALNAAETVREQERRIERLPRPARQAARGAMDFFRRALSAISGEGPIESAAAQLQMGQAYVAADQQMRERLSAVSERLESAGNIRAMEALVSHPEERRRVSPQEAARRVLGPDAPQEAVDALARRFTEAGGSREERGRWCERAEGQGTASVILLGRRDALSQLRSQAGEGTQERGIFDRVIGAVDGILTSLSRAEDVSQERLRGAEAQMVMLLGTEDEIAATFATSEDPQERAGQLETVRGLRSAREAMEGLRGEAREQAAGMYQRGMASLEEGNFQDAAAYFSFAQSFCMTDSDAEREAILREFRRFDGRGMGAEQAERLPPDERPVSAEAGREMARYILDREAALASAGSGELHSRVLRYYNFAYRALRGGDSAGAQLMRGLADMFGRASRLDQSDPEVQRMLALAQGNAGLGLPSMEQLTERMYENPPPTVAEVMFSGSSPEEAARRLDELQLRLSDYDLGLGQAEFNSRRVEIDTPRSRSRYEAERARLERRRAGAGSEEAEALARQLEHVDLEGTAARAGHAEEYYRQGVALLREAGSLRLQALRAADESERDRLDAEATARAQRGSALIQAAEGLQQSALGLHRSITTLTTRRRERGRAELSRAASAFEEAGQAVISAPAGELSRETIAEVSGLFHRGSADLQTGSVEVAQQGAIQQQVRSLLRQARQLEEQNERYWREYGRGSEHPVYMPQPPDQPSSYREPAYDAAWVQRRIDRGRRMARAERFAQSRRYLGAAQRGMPVLLERVRVAQTHWRLRDGDPEAGILPASEEERRWNRLEEFPTEGLDGQLRRALIAIDRGRFGEAEELTDSVRDQVVWRGERQRRSNFRSAIRETREYLERQAHPGSGFGELTTRQEIDMGARGVEAHSLNVGLIRGLGIFDDIHRDRQEVIGSLRDAEDAYTRAIEAVHSRDDLTPPGVAYSLASMVFRMSGSREGEGDIGRLRPLPVEQLRDAVEARDEAAIMRILHNDPALLRDAAHRLRELGDRERREQSAESEGITEGVELGLIADAGYGRVMRDYQEHATGWNFSMIAAQRGLEALDRADALTQSSVTDHFMRDALRGHAASYLQLAQFAARSPGSVSEAVRTGRGITLDQISLERAGTRDSLGLTVHDGFSIRHGSSHETRGIVGAFQQAARGELEILQDIGQSVMGMGPSAERPPDEAGLRELERQLEEAQRRGNEGEISEARQRLEMGRQSRALYDRLGASSYDLLFGYYREAAGVGDADVRMTFAGLGFNVDPRTGRGTRIEDMSREEEQALREAMSTVSAARQHFMNATVGLRTWVSHDERGAIYRRVLTQTSIATGTVDGLLRGRAAREGESAADRTGRRAREADAARGRIAGAGGEMNRFVEQQIREGGEEDRTWGIVRTVIEIPAAALVSAVPGGGILVAGYFLTHALEGFEEQRLASGGWDQMSRTQQILAGGGVALAALGFATAGMSSFLGEAGNLARGAGGLRSVLGAEATAGLELAPVAVTGELSRGAMLMQRAVGTSHYLMIGGGLLMGELQVLDMYGQYLQQRRRGIPAEFGWGEAFLAAFQAAQPFMQMGVHGAAQRWRPSLMYGSGFGARMYRGTMLAVFGVTQHDM
ncbi:MAG: hypothetical protein AB1324_05625, partial [Candidatus Micrarchaeota archaeon]